MFLPIKHTTRELLNFYVCVGVGTYYYYVLGTYLTYLHYRYTNRIIGSVPQHSTAAAASSSSDKPVYLHSHTQLWLLSSSVSRWIMKREGIDESSSSTKRAKESALLEPNTWHIIKNDALMVKLAPTPTSKITTGTVEGKMKVFAFDMDGCIIETKSGNSFAKDKNDWRFFHGMIITLRVHPYAKPHTCTSILIQVISSHMYSLIHIESMLKNCYVWCCSISRLFYELIL